MKDFLLILFGFIMFIVFILVIFPSNRRKLHKMRIDDDKSDNHEYDLRSIDNKHFRR